jgi:4-hydroxybenzoate polyprenyltransferase
MTGTWAPSKRTGKNILVGFISLQRPTIALMGPLMFLAGMFLAMGSVPSLEILLLSFIAVYLLTAAEHTIDDCIDKEIDKTKWPERALPKELIPRWQAGVYAILMAISGMLLSYYLFNWQLVQIEILALLLGTAYPYMRNALGYLVLIPIPALIGIGGWVAVSPGIHLTSNVPWLLYLFFVSWQGFHILATPWAIRVQEAFIVKPSPRNTAILSVAFSFAALIFGILLYWEAGLHFLFLPILVAFHAMYIVKGAAMIADPLNDGKVFAAFGAATGYNILLCIIICIFAVW